MSQRAHFWIRFVALAVIVAISYLPARGSSDRNADNRPAEVARAAVAP